MRMKINNEKLLKKNIHQAVVDLTLCLSDLRQVKSDANRCLKKIADSEKELSAVYTSNEFFSIEKDDGTLKSPDEITPEEIVIRKKELADVVAANRKCLTSLGTTEANLTVKSMGLKEPIRTAREAYCTAYEKALKETPEWKVVNENMESLKALWLLTFSGNIYVEDIVNELGLHALPSDRVKEKVRAELFIN